MPLLKPKQKAKRLPLRIVIAETIFEEIKLYCQWLQIGKFEELFEQAATYVLSRDKDWLRSKETICGGSTLGSTESEYKKVLELPTKSPPNGIMTK